MAMAAAANKAVAEKSFGFLRQSLGLLRNFSASASPPQATAGGDAEKTKRRKKKNLFDVVQFLPNWGIGYKVAKSHWRDVSYEITKINLYKDGRHGKAWGISERKQVMNQLKLVGSIKEAGSTLKKLRKKLRICQKRESK